jgi:hypothetical protein
MGQAKIGLVGSCILGLLTPILTRVLSDALKGWEIPFIYILPFVAVGIFAWFVATWVQSQPKMAVALLYVMIPLGVLVDVMIDGVLNKVDRNLFPFEILFWIVLAPLPIWLGYLLRRNKRSKAR